MRGRTAAAVAALTLACSGDRPAPPPSAPVAVTTSLGGVLVARVGDVPIDRALVLEVARARKIGAREALSHVIDDVLLARGALANGAENEAQVTFRTASALSRTLLGKLRARALETPFTDAEIDAVTAGAWLSVDHPEIRLVVHALVKKDVPNPRAAATELRAAVLAATDPDPRKSEAAFREAAKNFKVEPPVHIEILRITEDSRVAEPNVVGKVEDSFAKGVFAIPEVQGTSEPVETSYGFHVIRLLEKTPPVRLTREQKVEKLTPELLANRATPMHDALLAQLRAGTKTEIVATDALLAMPR